MKKKIIIASGIIVVIIIIGIFAFFAFIDRESGYRMLGQINDEEPHTFFNMSKQQIEKFSCFKELILNKHIDTIISKDEFWEIHDFFEDNNYPLGDITHIKYQDEFYTIEFDKTE